MTAPRWPGTLPQYLGISGTIAGVAENRLRSDVDIGPAKTRRLTPLNVRPLSGTMRMTTAQWLELRSFVESTLMGGVHTFSFPDPLDYGATRIEVRFADELPRARATSPGRWIVQMDLEEMP